MKLKYIFSRLKPYFPIKMSPFLWFLSLLQFYYLYEVFVTDDTGGFSFNYSTILYIIWSQVTIVFLFSLVGLLFQRRWLHVCSQFLLIALYTLSVAYHFGSNELFDSSILFDNFTIVFSENALDVMYYSLDEYALSFLPKIIGVFLVFEVWKRAVSKGIHVTDRLKKGVFGFVFYIFLLFSPLDSYDPLLTVFRTIPNYFFSPSLRVNLEPDQYPLLSSGSEQFISIDYKEKPYIFLIIVESLNQSVLHKRNEEGVEITPFLNQLESQSVTLKRFYGNSVQTAKGHFATLFSMIPSLKGKTFVKYPDLKIDSVASALKFHGYETRFFSAFHSKTFDNTADFLLKRGFQKYDVLRPMLSEEEYSKKFRWGVKDSVYFKHFFDYFDAKQDINNSPQFYTLSTIVNHFPFNSVPDGLSAIHPEPDSLNEDYENSVHLTDKGLAVFFEELKKRNLMEKSIIIITGDHAFPMGEHGNYHLEAGYHEESFLIPFFLLWEGKLTPQKLDKVGSQLDVVPTILDLLSVSIKDHNFQGHSIFNPKKDNYFIPLIQPYAKHFSLIQYPYKYRFYSKTQSNYLYDLEKDPMEKENSIKILSLKEREKFMQGVRRLYLSQKAIELNQIRP